MTRILIITSLLLLLPTACTSHSPAPATAPQTNIEGAPSSSTDDWALGAMVVAPDPQGVKAAIEMLAQGGHAVDAAIAAHAVLSLVEPQSSGLGGSAFMLTHERGEAPVMLDGRETAPAGATLDAFLPDGAPIAFPQRWWAGVNIGVPGTIALYAQAHELHGRLPWRSLFQPAIRLARDGFTVSPRLAGYLSNPRYQGALKQNPQVADYFFPGGAPLAIGDTRTNEAFAAALSIIAEHGPKAFYQGQIAADIVATAQAEPHAGSLSLADMKGYQSLQRQPACGGFRDMTVCSAAPPSSGPLQIMIPVLYDLLLQDTAPESGLTQADRIAAFVDAQRLAYADRDHYFGDPDQTPVPVAELTDPVYLKHRAGERFAPDAAPVHGNPAEVLVHTTGELHRGPDTTHEVAGTSHTSIIDAEGNAVALTASVGWAFGSTRFVHGFFLNNEMTDFSIQAANDTPAPANAMIAGARPRSSMSPTLVFDADNELKMVTGSPGGSSIIAYVAKSLLGVFDWGLSAQASVDHPNIIARGKVVKMELPDGDAIAADLRQRGYTVEGGSGENSGLHVIVVHPDRLEGAADKRRDGIVMTWPGSR